MRTPVLLLMAFSTMAVTAYVGQAIAVSESGTWSDPDKGKFSIEGVCEVTPEKVGCWDFEGKENASLSAEVKGFFEKEYPSIEFRVGKKNRYLVTNWAPTITSDRSIGLTGPGKPPTFRMGTLTGSPTMAGRGLTPVTAAPDAKDFEATFKLTVPSKDKSFTLKLEKGAKAVVDDKTVEIERIEKVVPEALSSLMLRNVGVKQAWKIHVKATNVRLNYLEMQGPRKTKDGKDFRFIDDKGNPDPNAKPTGPRTFSHTPFFSLGQDRKTGQMWFETTVNPDKVESFQFTPRTPREESVQFKGIPADPKPNGGSNR